MKYDLIIKMLSKDNLRELNLLIIIFAFMESQVDIDWRI